MGAEDELIPIQVEYGESVPKSSEIVLQTVNVHVADVAGIKRKRGRPRKNEKVVVYENKDTGEDRDKEILNKNGVVVDLVGLANVEDPFCPELKRRTEGLETEEELLGFLSELEGQWGSRRKKRKIVEASDFGDVLPKGWKLVLCLKKREGRVWLICRRYISPNGREFVSCKEVSSYLQFIFGHQDASQQNSGHINESIQLSPKMLSGNVSYLTYKGDDKRDELAIYSPATVTSMSSDHEKQEMLLKVGDSGEGQEGPILKNHKHTMASFENDDLSHNISHKRTRKRRRSGATISDGVIIKDGKFECQFCHKIFHERHRYNGHVGIHMKNYMRSVEASQGVIPMQKSADPVFLGGLPPRVSEMHISIATSSDCISNPSNARAIDSPNSGNPCSELKAGHTVENYTDQYNHEFNSLSQDRQDMKDNRSDKFLVEESSCQHDGGYKMADDKLGTMVEDSEFVAEIALYDSEKNETNALKCTNGRGQEKSSESCVLTFSGNEQTGGVENNLVGVSISIIEESKQDIGLVTGSLNSYCFEKTHSAENIADKLFTSTAEQHKVDGGERFGDKEPLFDIDNRCTGPDEDVVSGFKHQESFGSYPFVSFGNDQKDGFVNNANGVCHSVMEKSKEDGSSKRDLLIPLDVEQTCDVHNVANQVSTSMLGEPKFDEVGNSGDKETIIGFGSSHGGLYEDAVTSVEKEVRSKSSPCIQSNDVSGVSTCTIEESCKEKGSESSLQTPPSSEKTGGVEKNVNNVSTGTILEFGLDEVKNNRNSKQISSASGLDVDIETSLDQEQSPKSLVFLPVNEQTFGVQNDITKFCNSTVEEPEQERISERGLLNSPGNDQNNENNVKVVSTNTINVPKLSWSNELVFALGCGHTEPDLDANRNFETHSLVFSGNEQTFGVENNATGIFNNVVEEPKQASGSNLLSLFGNEQACSVENNLNRAYTDNVWEGHKLAVMENSVNDELMIGFGNSHARADEDVVSNALWRTEEDILQRGLAGSSLSMGQSSGCFPSFDIISDKGENELFGASRKFDSISGFEGLRSGGIEQLEYSFLTGQTNSLPEDSKMLEYDAEMEGFDSSFWLRKEALLPMVASRNQPSAICAWCRNEFCHETFNPGTEGGSIGLLCPTCKAKMSMH